MTSRPWRIAGAVLVGLLCTYTEPAQSRNPKRKVMKDEKQPVTTQTMTNSPGGIQAGRDVVMGSRLIHSLVIRISLEVETPETNPTEKLTDVGYQSLVALFTADKTRIRFATDFMIHDQQVGPKTRRLSLVYTPETPNEIQGREIAFLESISLLAVNYVDLLKLERFALNGEAVELTFVVELNGVEIGGIRTIDKNKTLTAGQSNLDVTELFKEIPEQYRKKVGLP